MTSDGHFHEKRRDHLSSEATADRSVGGQRTWVSQQFQNLLQGTGFGAINSWQLGTAPWDTLSVLHANSTAFWMFSRVTAVPGPAPEIHPLWGCRHLPHPPFWCLIPYVKTLYTYNPSSGFCFSNWIVKICKIHIKEKFPTYLVTSVNEMLLYPIYWLWKIQLKWGKIIVHVWQPGNFFPISHVTVFWGHKFLNTQKKWFYLNWFINYVRVVVKQRILSKKQYTVTLSGSHWFKIW